MNNVPDAEIVIRGMLPSDAQVIADEEVRQGWNATPEKYEMRLRDQAEGQCVSLVAAYRGQPAGYINVYFHMKEGPAAGLGYPVIVDFGVLEKYRRRGIGTRLMDAAEEIAAERFDTVWLAVGLHNGYGAAQRLYVRRGYIPDGTGVWYRGKPCTPYDTVWTNDDDLELFLSKRLVRKPARSAERNAPMTVREAGPEDIPAAAALAARLWPHADKAEMAEDLRQELAGGECAVILAFGGDEPVGFAQCQLRHDYVEGTDSSPVGYLEGIYVAEDLRGAGLARELLRHCEAWAKEKGCAEFASDCELDNLVSQAFHARTGFREANRIVCFVKPL